MISGCGSSPGNHLFTMLPGDGEVEDWRRSASPTLVDSDAELYSQIDGAAPKYIDRGWQRTLYASYAQGGLVLMVALHDMGTAYNAEALFNVDLPVSRVAVQGFPNSAIDLGLATAYRAIAFTDRYYVELSLDDRSDASLVSIDAFAAAVLRR